MTDRRGHRGMAREVLGLYARRPAFARSVAAPIPGRTDAALLQYVEKVTRLLMLDKTAAAHVVRAQHRIPGRYTNSSVPTASNIANKFYESLLVRTLSFRFLLG
ncbi:hypothetical protein NL676_023113 [Syzygium grande]|nr:hypothetical protein NL676_023113 [Syzygium grande]